ncbi:CD276 antigen-like [Brachyhypopomus gauderio]|uniref:CD276 antigen-like n=1 Tax=Brachyhypopomus gauderio TaxID=698409 RepID=UPI0040438124
MELRADWLSANTIVWLVLSVDSSPLSSLAGYTVEVGCQAVLSCVCSSYVAALPQSPYIQWQTVSRTVFERMGEDWFQGEAYENRADVPMEMLAKGNCSLILSDVRFRDEGIYQSFLVVGQSTIRSRILVQSVQLAVVDHKHMQSVEMGKDLILDLYNNQAEMLEFQSESAPRWSVLWQQGQGRASVRVVQEKDGVLVVPGVAANDSGTYRLMDADGLALSTVKVSVTDSGRVDAPSFFLTVVLFVSSHALLCLV